MKNLSLILLLSLIIVVLSCSANNKDIQGPATGTWKDVVYATVSNTHKLDIYLPSTGVLSGNSIDIQGLKGLCFLRLMDGCQMLVNTKIIVCE